MANNLSVLLGAELGAAAPFYGGAPKPEDVPKIKAGHPDPPRRPRQGGGGGLSGAGSELKKNKIRYEGHIYPNSVHGFFNDATPERYNKAAAQQAWTRTIEWFNQYVRGA